MTRSDVKGGTYLAQLVLSRSLGPPAVTIQAAPGETVNTGSIGVTASYLTISGFHLGNNAFNVAGEDCSRTGVTVANNTLAGPKASIKISCGNTTVVGNDISGTNACAGGEEDSIQAYGNGPFGAVIPSNLTIRGNYIHDQARAFGACGTHADGIQLFGCQSCVIDGNRFNNTDTSFVIIYAPNNSRATDVQNILVQNNSFGAVEEPGHGVSIGGQACSADQPNNIVIQGNTFYGGNTADFGCAGGHVAGTFRDNVLAGGAGQVCSQPGVLDFNAFASGACGSHAKTCTPAFVDGSHAGGNIDILASDTCARDAASSAPGTFPDHDIHGTPRPLSLYPDIGADEG